MFSPYVTPATLLVFVHNLFLKITTTGQLSSFTDDAYYDTEFWLLTYSTLIANSLSYDKNDLRRPVLAGYNNRYSILVGYDNGNPDLLEVGPTQIVENNRILQKVTSLGEE